MKSLGWAIPIVLCSFIFGLAQQSPAPVFTPHPPSGPATKNKPKVKAPDIIIVPRQVPQTAPAPIGRVMTIGKRIMNESDSPAEKSIEVDPKVVVTVVVSEGKIKINGWKRDEIRAFVEGGSEVGFKVVQTNKESGKPAWVKVVGYDPTKHKGVGLDESLTGEDIQLDVPYNAIVKMAGGNAEISVDSVSSVEVKNVDGNISLYRIKSVIEALTYAGDIIVQNSSGAISLTATGGNIVAASVAPNQAGDVLRVKTYYGAINLRSVSHLQVNTSSTSGAIRYYGVLERAGQYTFQNNSGSIYFAIPVESSCRIQATYGGSFTTEIPLSEIRKDESFQVRRLTGQIGAGEAGVTFVTLNGAIKIVKKN